MIHIVDVYAAVNCPSGTTLGVDCWECGTNCTAYLSNDTTNTNGNKQLNITGSGAMRDYGHYGSPWFSQAYKITNLVIEGAKRDAYGNLVSTGITYLGKNSFQDLRVKDIILPDSITSIGQSALGWSNSLESVVIPDSVSSTSTYIFQNAFKLKDVRLSESLTQLRVYTFTRTDSLEALVLPDTIDEISSSAFNGSIGVVYCPSYESCSSAGLRDDQIKVYEKDEMTGIYRTISDGKTYASPVDMQKELTCDDADTTSERYCAKLIAEYKDAKAESMAGGALCGTKEGCLKLLNMVSGELKDEDGNAYVCATNGAKNTIANCKAYGDAHDIMFGNYAIRDSGGGYALYDDNKNFLGYKGKRIYTVQEANQVSKPTGNRVSLRYK